jgi:hypothetical protein
MGPTPLEHRTRGNPRAPGVTSLGVRLDNLDELPFARTATRVRVTVMQIPDSAAAPVHSLATEFVRDLDVHRGSTTLTIDRAQRNAVYVIAITALPR